MGARAVFASQGLAIYITKEHVDEILKSGLMHVSLYLNKDLVSVNQVHVTLDEATTSLLTQVLQVERKVIKDKQREFRAANPDYENARDRRPR